MFDLEGMEGRKELIEYCNSDYIKELKNESIKEFEVYKNKLKDHVYKTLTAVRSQKNVDKMLLIDDIGVCKRTINQKASIYQNTPTREFKNLNDAQKEAIERAYNDMKANSKGKFANRYFKLQKQTLTQILPKGGKLIKKVLKRHEYTLIAGEDGESIEIVVIHNFNQPDDKTKQRYVVWSPEFNFLMDGTGLILTDENNRANPIAPLLPFTEYALEKDGDVYVDEKETSVNFTLKLNAMMTEIYHIMRMQGFGQPVLVGPKKAFPNEKEIVMGVDDILVLITGEDGNARLEFVNANPDLQGNIDTISVLLSAWLSSEGLDMNSIKFKSDGEKGYSSGFERLLALIEKFQATQDDMEVFKDGERNEFKIVAKYLEVLSGDREQLDSKYAVSTMPDNADMSIEFAKPEEIQTRPEKIKMLKEAEEAGYGSRITAIKELKGFKSDEDAIDFIKMLEEHKTMFKAEEVDNGEGVRA